MTEELLANAYIKGASDLLQGKIEIRPLPKFVAIPDGATNKDAFKAVFGYEPATDAVVCNKEDWCGESEPCKYCKSNSDNIGKEEDWWDAPYILPEEELE